MISENELIIDSFAGGGGASTGIEMATGRSPDIAINHDPEAIAMHRMNHPTTRHYCNNIYQVDPDDIIREHQRRIGLAWFSPDCTHHSKARGGKPREKHIRDLAWVVVKWAERAVYKGQRIRIIHVENVEEFQDWGPLLADGTPDPMKKSFEFRGWVKALEKLGYKVEWRMLRACDYGAPTIRKRLFVIARCDGEPIVWPEPTHGPELIPHRAAAECIDFSLPCHSIFLSQKEAKAQKLKIKRPLAEKTMHRLARGVKRYVIDAKEPFIVNLTHHGGDRNESLNEPFRTITGANRGEKALITPFLTEHANGSSPRNFPGDEPLRTQCAQVKGGHFALATPFITKFRTGSTGQPLDEPLHTITAGGKSERPAGAAHAMGLGAAFLAAASGPEYSAKPKSVEMPLNTITADCRAGACAAFLAQHNNHPGGVPNLGRSVDEPVSTITASGAQQQVVTVFLSQHNGQSVGQEAEAPLSTITGKDKVSVTAAFISKMRGENIGHGIGEPSHTISAQGTHHAEGRAFLQKYFGTEQDPRLDEPLHTVTAKDRFGVAIAFTQPAPLEEWQLERARKVSALLRKYELWDDREFVTIEWTGSTWILWDIGMRMLEPRELYLAQGFPPSYEITLGTNEDGMIVILTKTAQVRMCGNSVSPPVVAAIVRGQLNIQQVRVAC